PVPRNEWMDVRASWPGVRRQSRDPQVREAQPDRFEVTEHLYWCGGALRREGALHRSRYQCLDGICPAEGGQCRRVRRELGHHFVERRPCLKRLARERWSMRETPSTQPTGDRESSRDIAQPREH